MPKSGIILRIDFKRKNGGAKGSRTPDLLNAIQALYQLSYGPNGLDHKIFAERVAGSTTRKSAAYKRPLPVDQDTRRSPHALVLRCKLKDGCWPHHSFDGAVTPLAGVYILIIGTRNIANIVVDEVFIVFQEWHFIIARGWIVIIQFLF
jgi:hypothetical protein